MLEFMLLATFTCVNIQLKQSKIYIKQIQKLTFLKFQLIYGISVHLRAPGRKNPSNCNSHRIISVETLHMATRQGKRKNVLPARADKKSL